MAKISVIVPVYNIEKYLEQCLESLVSQTFGDIEIICINDGSTDKSENILQEYAKKDNRFVVLTQENQGPGVARNKGIELAQGEYIMFVDPDDWIEPNACEVLYNKFQETKTDVIQFDFKNYYDYSKQIVEFPFNKRVRNMMDFELENGMCFNRKQFNDEYYLPNIFMSVWHRAYRTSFIKENNIRFAPTLCTEDNLFVISVFALAKEIYYLNENLYFYRQREKSIVNQVSMIYFDIFKNISITKQFLEEHKVYEEMEKEFVAYKIDVLNWCLVRIPEKDRKEFKEKCREILTKDEYERFEEYKKFKVRRSVLRNIFSIKNENSWKGIYKVITILGLKIRLKK